MVFRIISLYHLGQGGNDLFGLIALFGLTHLSDTLINFSAFSRSTFSLYFVVQWINMHYGKNIVLFLEDPGCKCSALQISSILKSC